MNLRFIIAVGIFFLWIMIGTIGFSYIENWGFIDSFYFSVTTLTTVGYGDIIPSTDIGRLFTSIFILFGVTSVIGGSMVIIGTQTINHGEKKIEKKIKFNK